MSSPAPRPPSMRTPPPPRAPKEGGAGFWPAVAIIAIMVATAGWTTVAVMALNGSSQPVAEAPLDGESIAPDESFDDTGDGASDEPVVETHDAPDLEALLPTQIGDTAMTLQSWTGTGLLEDGGQWADSITTYLGTVNKTTDDLSAAQAYDATEASDSSINLFRLNGVAPDSFRDAMVAAWKDSYPDMKVSTVKLDGTDVTKGDFGEDAIDSYWYIKDGLVYDIEASDEAAATTILKGLRDGTFPTSSGGAPASGAPDGSEAPAASASPS
jgi:hypothetical protein